MIINEGREDYVFFKPTMKTAEGRDQSKLSVTVDQDRMPHNGANWDTGLEPGKTIPVSN